MAAKPAEGNPTKAAKPESCLMNFLRLFMVEFY
jgi:hypothetical protein